MAAIEIKSGKCVIFYNKIFPRKQFIAKLDKMLKRKGT